MKTKMLMPLLLLTAVCATPASANYFSNTTWNTILNIGSAPSPTPAQLRAIGDSSDGPAPVRQTLAPRAQAAPPPAVQAPVEPIYDNSYDDEVVGSDSNDTVIAPSKVAVTKTTTTKVAHTKVATNKSAAIKSPAKASLAAMEGKVVYGSKGERLGHVLAVNEQARLVDMQLPTGIAVSIPAALVADKGSRVVAPTMTTADTMAMAKSQTGRTVALNMTMKNSKLTRA